MQSVPQLQSLIKELASEAGVDPSLACAVVEQESSWNPNATRYEPAFFKRYIEKMNLPEEEAKNRSTSWGLMQLMGEVAREQGFKGNIPDLCDPSIGVPESLKHLKHFLLECKGDVHATLLRWNGGGNPKYPDEVLTRQVKYK